jgi:hypothetical protein
MVFRDGRWTVGWSSSLITLGLALCAAPLDAQAVRGELVDRGTGRPIEAAFVTLLDSAGLEVARALTSLGGTFLLHAPAQGHYRVRSKRIGFRPSESPLLALTDSGPVAYRLEVDAVPVELPAVVVRGRPHCGARTDAAAVAQLWEEAREALAAVKWTEDQGTLRYAVERFERSLPLTGRRILAEWDSSWSGVGAKPFQSVPAEQLARDGYVVRAAGDSLDFHGPDADVLLGDLFLSTHCFGAREGGDERPGLVGLTFEPDPRRRRPDVAGVLWLDRRTLELEFLEFTYTGLRENNLGGHVEFTRLASGPWIVTHWWIRTAHLDQGQRRRLRRWWPRVVGYREAGGTVTLIESSSKAVEYVGSLALLEGAVVDSSRGGTPLPGAVVWLVGSSRQVRADEHGGFAIRGPFDGEYGVSFHHSRLDSLGIGAPEQRVTLSRGVRQFLPLFVPPEAEVLRRLCPDLRPDGLVVVGVVRDSSFNAVPRARIHVRLATVELRARADSAGRFVICDAPAGPLTVSAEEPPEGRGAVVLEFKDGGVWVNGTQFHRLTGRVWKQDIRLSH